MDIGLCLREILDQNINSQRCTAPTAEQSYESMDERPWISYHNHRTSDTRGHSLLCQGAWHGRTSARKSAAAKTSASAISKPNSKPAQSSIHFTEPLRYAISSAVGPTSLHSTKLPVPISYPPSRLKTSIFAYASRIRHALSSPNHAIQYSSTSSGASTTTTFGSRARSAEQSIARPGHSDACN